jgi:hypothetical protein
MLVAGCDSGPLRNFAGGTNSKDKTPIPPAVNAASAPAPGSGAVSAAAPVIQGPVAADKAALPHIALPPPDQALRESSDEYRAGRERDPFLSLLSGHESKTGLVDPSIVRLVGIVQSGERPFCVVEDPEGISYILYVGDPVRNGRVVAIKADTVVCSQTVLGYTNTVQLKLAERKGVKNG